MFVGHLALAFAAKRAKPAVSLGWYVAGVTALDLVWPIFVLTGVEIVRIAPGATAFTPFVFESYPWSHSLLLAAVWGVVLAAIVRVARGSAPALLLMGLVVSHWVLDFVTHAPDLPLWPGASPHLGLGLWNSVPATLAVEGAMWVAGLAFYLSRRKARGLAGSVGLWLFIGLCTIMWVSGPFGSVPPNSQALGWLALTGWIMPFWAAAADRGYSERT